MSWKGGYNTNKKTNKKIAIAILLSLFLQSLGLFRAIGFDLTTPLVRTMPGLNVLNFILFGGTVWIAYGLQRYRIA